MLSQTIVDPLQIVLLCVQARIEGLSVPDSPDADMPRQDGGSSYDPHNESYADSAFLAQMAACRLS